MKLNRHTSGTCGPVAASALTYFIHIGVVRALVVLAVDIDDEQPRLVAGQEDEESVPVELHGRQQVPRLLRRDVHPPRQRRHLTQTRLKKHTAGVALFIAGLSVSSAFPLIKFVPRHPPCHKMQQTAGGSKVLMRAL